MWLQGLQLAFKAGSHIFKQRQQTKMLMADAQRLHAEKMARGEVEMQQIVRSDQQQSWKDEFVLLLVSAPVLLLIWSVFSDDPDIKTKIDLFFEYFKVDIAYTLLQLRKLKLFLLIGFLQFLNIFSNIFVAFNTKI